MACERHQCLGSGDLFSYNESGISGRSRLVSVQTREAGGTCLLALRLDYDQGKMGFEHGVVQGPHVPKDGVKPQDGLSPRLVLTTVKITP